MDELGALAEALVANGVGPRICGLLLLGGLVAGALCIGRGSDLQRCLVHLQAEGLVLLCSSCGQDSPCHGTLLGRCGCGGSGPRYQGAPARLCDPNSLNNHEPRGPTET